MLHSKKTHRGSGNIYFILFFFDEGTFLLETSKTKDNIQRLNNKSTILQNNL
jgi:hypothetical protein